MELGSALIIYLILVIIAIIIFYKLGLTIWGSFLYAFVIGLIILLIIVPPSDIDPWSTGSESTSAIYLLILFVTPIYIAVYALIAAWKNKRPKSLH